MDRLAHQVVHTDHMDLKEVQALLNPLHLHLALQDSQDKDHQVQQGTTSLTHSA